MTSTSATSPMPSETASCIDMTPDSNGYVPPEACNALYLYYPSFGAALAMSVIFGIATLIHLAQGIAYRKKFTWVVIMGASWETISFILRTLSTKDQQNEGYVTGSQLLVYLAPLWINAFDYMVLGRMVYYYLPEQKLFLKATSFSKYFVWLDILSFIVQAAGAIMVSGSNIPEHQLNTGKNIYMAGIGVQLAFIVVFIGLVIVFHQRVAKLEVEGENVRPRWQRLTYALLVSLLAISMRIIFRLVEFSKGFNLENPIIRDESYLYALDAMPTALALFAMSAVHPGTCLRGPESEFPHLSRKEKKAAKKAAKEEKEQAKAEKKLQQESSSSLETSV